MESVHSCEICMVTHNANEREDKNSKIHSEQLSGWHFCVIKHIMFTHFILTTTDEVGPITTPRHSTGK